MLLRKFEKGLSGKVYTSVDDMPIYNWCKVHDTGDYSHILIDRIPLPSYSGSVLKRKWEKIYDTYLERFGFAPGFLEILNLQKKVARLKVRKMTSGDRSIQTLIDIAQWELKKKQENKPINPDFNKVKVMVEKNMGFHLDPHKVTVAEFFAYLR